LIEPISTEQQQLVIDQSLTILNRSCELFQRNFKPLPIQFDLKGKAAGMYCVRGRKRWIRFNPYIFAKYFADNLANTVSHEMAHYVVDVMYGQRNVRPHGDEWIEVMKALGAKPERTCQYDLEGVPRRVQKLFEYACACRQHQLGSCRHNRVSRGQTQYYCRQCRQTLVFAGQ